MLREHPAHLERLFRPFWYYRSGAVGPEEEPTVHVPIFDWHHARLRVRYNRQRLEDGYACRDLDLEGEDLEAIDCFEQHVEEPGLSLPVHLEAGDLLMTNNRVIVHARDAFEDAEPSSGRYLYHLWIERTGSVPHALR